MEKSGRCLKLFPAEQFPYGSLTTAPTTSRPAGSKLAQVEVHGKSGIAETLPGASSLLSMEGGIGGMEPIDACPAPVRQRIGNVNFFRRGDAFLNDFTLF